MYGSARRAYNAASKKTKPTQVPKGPIARITTTINDVSTVKEHFGSGSQAQGDDSEAHMAVDGDDDGDIPMTWAIPPSDDPPPPLVLDREDEEEEEPPEPTPAADTSFVDDTVLGVRNPPYVNLLQSGNADLSLLIRNFRPRKRKTSDRRNGTPTASWSSTFRVNILPAQSVANARSHRARCFAVVIAMGELCSAKTVYSKYTGDAPSIISRSGLAAALTGCRWDSLEWYYTAAMEGVSAPSTRAFSLTRCELLTTTGSSSTRYTNANANAASPIASQNNSFSTGFSRQHIYDPEQHSPFNA